MLDSAAEDVQLKVVVVIVKYAFYYAKQAANFKYYTLLANHITVKECSWFSNAAVAADDLLLLPMLRTGRERSQACQPEVINYCISNRRRCPCAVLQTAGDRQRSDLLVPLFYCGRGIAII